MKRKEESNMKKIYEAPDLEIETYELDASIASHCADVINDGPAIGDHTECENYNGPDFGDVAAVSLFSLHNVIFYDDVDMCDCYTTGGDQGFWTS